jgi:nucleoredoxin
MRLSLLCLLLAGSLAANSRAGNLPPLTIKDVSLMLRSGYSATSVQQEVAARHFIGAVDPAAEASLIQAGASPEFAAALRTGTYAVPAGEAAAVQQDLAAKAQRRALQQEEARKYSTLYQAQVAAARAAATPLPATGTDVIGPLVKGDLVVSKNGNLAPYPDEAFAKKKLIGLYFSAHWCGPCRQFTPELVKFYNRVAAAHPEFEIVFVSHDKSAAAMQAYMRDMQMPWPAVGFEKVPSKLDLNKYAGDGIPCLVVVESSGKVVSDSFAGKNYRGPSVVLTELDQLFAKNSPPQVALQR